MTDRDIVERLRESAEGWFNEVDTRREAADEIERLRLEVSATHDMAATLEADIVQLRAEVLEQCRLNGMGGSREAKLIAERDQLRARVAELEAALEQENARWSWYVEQMRCVDRYHDFGRLDPTMAEVRAAIDAARLPAMKNPAP